jgi:hypothetical protein
LSVDAFVGGPSVEAAAPTSTEGIAQNNNAQAVADYYGIEGGALPAVLATVPAPSESATAEASEEEKQGTQEKAVKAVREAVVTQAAPAAQEKAAQEAVRGAAAAQMAQEKAAQDRGRVRKLGSAMLAATAVAKAAALSAVGAASVATNLVLECDSMLVSRLVGSADALIQAGASVVAVDVAGLTPLHLTLRSDGAGPTAKMAVAERLARNGAQLEAKCRLGTTPLSILEEPGQPALRMGKETLEAARKHWKKEQPTAASQVGAKISAWWSGGSKKESKGKGKQPQQNQEKDRSDLMAGAAARAEERNAKLGEGAVAGKGDPRTQAVLGANSSMSDTMDSMKNNMNERGEKLADLAQKAQELDDASSEFLKMATALRKQQERPWWQQF